MHTRMKQTIIWNNIVFVRSFDSNDGLEEFILEQDDHKTQRQTKTINAIAEFRSVELLTIQ